MTPETRGSAIWIRVALWSLLLMVVAGVGLVWWVAERDRRIAAGPVGGGDELPILSEIPGFTLASRSGDPVTREDLDGRPWVANAIFTRCALTCPRMTSKMMALGTKLPDGVRRVSITVDPEHDRPEVLDEYAGSYGIGPEEDWLFLTGSPESIRAVVLDGMLLGYAETPADDERAELEPITHSTRFVLVDGRGRVRGYYDAFEERDVERLVADAGRLVE